MTAQPITKQQVAEQFGVSVRTVEEWMASGRIAYLKMGRLVKFTRAHVEAFEKAHTIKPTI